MPNFQSAMPNFQSAMPKMVRATATRRAQTTAARMATRSLCYAKRLQRQALEIFRTSRARAATSHAHDGVGAAGQGRGEAAWGPAVIPLCQAGGNAALPTSCPLRRPAGVLLLLLLPQPPVSPQSPGQAWGRPHTHSAARNTMTASIVGVSCAPSWFIGL